jgi:hypothetical protein
MENTAGLEFTENCILGKGAKPVEAAVFLSDTLHSANFPYDTSFAPRSQTKRF